MKDLDELKHVFQFVLKMWRKEKSAQECKEWQTNLNWTITRLVQFSANFQPIVLHALDDPVIVNRTYNRGVECTKNCILMWNFPHMRFRWDFTILITIVRFLDSVTVPCAARLLFSLSVFAEAWLKHIWTSVCNGNRTEWGPIRSVIIRVITKSDDRTAGVRFVYHEYQLIIKITISDKNKNSQVMKNRGKFAVKYWQRRRKHSKGYRQKHKSKRARTHT